MKKVVKFLASSFLIALIIGCSNTADNPINAVGNQKTYTYSVSVIKNGTPVSNAKVMGVINEDEEIFSQCDKDGFATLTSEKPLTGICAVTLGASGFANAKDNELIEIQLLDVATSKENSLKKISSESFWYFYYVDGDGDAYYRYPLNHSFSHFWLYGNIPSWVYEPTDPNDWQDWYLTDYLPQFNGWKILIPRRAQWYYPIVYDREIEEDLYLVTTS